MKKWDEQRRLCTSRHSATKRHTMALAALIVAGLTGGAFLALAFLLAGAVVTGVGDGR